jgi:hypothetical protein
MAIISPALAVIPSTSTIVFIHSKSQNHLE